MYIWLNGAMFTAVAVFALLRDDHVRVIFSTARQNAHRAITDLSVAVIFFLLLYWDRLHYSIIRAARLELSQGSQRRWDAGLYISTLSCFAA